MKFELGLFGSSHDKKIVKDFILSKKGNIFVDIGAFTGFYTFRLVPFFKIIYAYEPYPESFMTLEGNYEMFKEHIKIKYGNIILKNIAISNFIGKGKLFLAKDETKHSLSVFTDKSIEVDCSTLAHEFPDQKIDFIKVDTEGNECDVIEGAIPIIQHIQSWIIEIHQYAEKEKLIKLLENSNYNLKWIGPSLYAWRD